MPAQTAAGNRADRCYACGAAREPEKLYRVHDGADRVFVCSPCFVGMTGWCPTDPACPECPDAG